MAYLDEKNRGGLTVVSLALETQRKKSLDFSINEAVWVKLGEKILVSEFDWPVQDKCYRGECMIALVVCLL